MSDPPRSSDFAGHAPEGRSAFRHDPRAGRFAGARILIVGCGDVGRRVVIRLGDRARISGTTRSVAGVAALRSLGVRALAADLDDPSSLARLGGVAPTVVHLAPPGSSGEADLRTRALLGALHGVRALIYVSTSGVYGDCAGAWIDETRTTAASTDRARRRVDAEQQLRAWARARRIRLTILRVPGIYASDRLPTARVAAGTPVLRAADDVYTNHIHADDLARAIVTAIHRGAAQRIYHVVDDSALRMGDWFDLVADAGRLPRPARLSRTEIGDRIPPALASFMGESRRLSNRRMREELGVTLAYPTVREGLAAATKKSPPESGLA